MNAGWPPEFKEGESQPNASINPSPKNNNAPGRAMTAVAYVATETRPDPVDIFRARCEARAILVEAGELAFLDAVDGLQQAAVRDGLVDKLGQNAIQRIMADAFARQR